MQSEADNKLAPGDSVGASISVRSPARLATHCDGRSSQPVFDEIIGALPSARPAAGAIQRASMLLEHAPGLKQSEVAAALGIQRANFVALFDGLERRGLARRSPIPTIGAPPRCIYRGWRGGILPALPGSRLNTRPSSTPAGPRGGASSS